MVILTLTTVEEYQKAIQSKSWVVIDFGATWCKPCCQLAPLYQELAQKYDDQKVIFCKVDVDNSIQLTDMCNIRCMPTLHIYHDGELVKNWSGAYLEPVSETLPQDVMLLQKTFQNLEEKN